MSTATTKVEAKALDPNCGVIYTDQFKLYFFNSSAKSLGLEINHSFPLKEADCIYGSFQSPKAQMKGRGQSGVMPHIRAAEGEGSGSGERNSQIRFPAALGPLG